MTFRIFFLVLLCPIAFFGQIQDTSSINYRFKTILAQDSSAIHGVMYNEMESVFAPALHANNLGGTFLNLKPSFELNDWMDASLFVFYNQSKNVENSKNPVSQASYSYGMDDSHYLMVKYSDHIYRTNVNAQFRRYASKGVFPNSNTKGLNFIVNFDKKIGRWNSKLSYYRNTYTIDENGGIDSLSDFLNGSAISQYNIITKLTTAKNSIVNQGGYFKNLFLFNGAFSDSTKEDAAMKTKVFHGISINGAVDRKEFVYSMSGDDLLKSYYANNYLNNEQTWDSTGYTQYALDVNYHILDRFKRNLLRLGYQQTLTNPSVLNKSELLASFKSYKIGEFSLNASYVLDGLWKYGRTISLSEKFNVSKRIYFEFGYTNDHSLPGYFFMKYNGNHFNWNNNFDFVDKNEGSLLIFDKKLKTGLSVNVKSLGNWIYFNEQSVPTQLKSTFVYSNITLQNAIQTKFIKFYTSVEYQKSASEVVRVPDFVLRNIMDYYFRLGKIKFTLGYIFTYFTSYNGMAYNPAIRRQYLQNSSMVGGFSLLDVFVAMKLGGAEIYAKYENLLFDNPSRDFFVYPNTPNMPKIIRVGFSWKFLE